MTSKKMRIPSIFKNKEAKQQLWQWPSCKHPKTLSFRAGNDDVFKTVNSVFLDVETPESLFTNSSESPSFSTDELSHDDNNLGSGEALETIIRGVRLSERLFFEPGETNSIMKEARNDDDEEGKKSDSNEVLPFKESVAMALESDDPYMDFKKSMQEMVESHGLKDWEGLEELLRWYLKMNGKMNHRFIVEAFADLLIGLDNDSSHSSYSTTAVQCSDEYQNSTWYSSAASSFSSSSFISPRSPTEVLGCEEIVVGREDENLVIQS